MIVFLVTRPLFYGFWILQRPLGLSHDQSYFDRPVSRQSRYCRSLHSEAHAGILTLFHQKHPLYPHELTAANKSCKFVVYLRIQKVLSTHILEHLEYAWYHSLTRFERELSKYSSN